MMTFLANVATCFHASLVYVQTEREAFCIPFYTAHLCQTKAKQAYGDLK